MNLTKEDEDLITSFFDQSLDIMNEIVGVPAKVEIRPTFNEILLIGEKKALKWDLDEMLATIKKQIV